MLFPSNIINLSRGLELHVVRKVYTSIVSFALYELIIAYRVQIISYWFSAGFTSAGGLIFHVALTL